MLKSMFKEENEALYLAAGVMIYLLVLMFI
jgi:hypothetical protein